MTVTSTDASTATTYTFDSPVFVKEGQEYCIVVRTHSNSPALWISQMGQTDIGGAIADADLFLVDDGAGGTLRKTAASRIKTYVGGFDVTSITGATALATQPDQTDEIVLSDAGTLKRLDIKHIQNTPSFYAELSSNQSINSGSWTKVTFDSEKHDSDGRNWVMFQGINKDL